MADDECPLVYSFAILKWASLTPLSIALCVTFHIETSWHGFCVRDSCKQLYLVSLTSVETTPYLQMFSCIAALHCDKNNATNGRKQHPMKSSVTKEAEM